MKKQANGATLGFEREIFQAADKLRKNVDAALYKHIVLGLVFLKYVGDRFEKRHTQIREETSNPVSKHYIEEERARYGVMESRDEYTAEGVFWVPKEGRWHELVKNATDPQIGKRIDDAMHAIEKENPKLKGILPKDYARANVDATTLTQLINLFAKMLDFTDKDGGNDVFGRIYEYGLREFATQEGKRGGQFYTPPCVVKLLVEMLQPYKGRVYDPCCGSGGMFVQSENFVEEHGGKRREIAIWGQESNQTTWRLCMMNLAVHGVEGDIQYNPEGSFLKDALPDLRADFVIANPPFNVKDWGQERLKEDARWNYGVPPSGNANFAWIQHFIHHLAPGGRAGFVLANGSLASQQSGEGEIRKRIIEAGLVECIVALPSQLFYNAQIPACLWFLRKATASTPPRDSILFIDARKLGRMESRVNRVLEDEDIAAVAAPYHAWQKSEVYEDVPGLCGSVARADILAHDGVLTPGRYVGAEEQEHDGEGFDARMNQLVAQLRVQQSEAAKLAATINENLRSLGYE